ncbi:DUF87 domain-containing protein, partial [Candidatus Woesearchaeota archaeon]|nr:DUF87 domain-containing protein [Candidatus Woesearchaeota archaeon]
MILGKIIGTSTTNDFKFLVDDNAKKFEYLQIFHEDNFVLCQIIELERDSEKTIAKCFVIGRKNKEGKIIPLRTPFQPGTEVLKAEDSFVREIIKLEKEQEGAFVGKLDGKNINIFLDLKKLLTKHVAVLAKSGSGKSYTVGVLTEEIMEKGIPLLIIDPHGEHSSLKYPNETEADKVIMPKFGVQPAAFIKQIQEYGDMNQNPNLKPLKLNSNLDVQELIALLPKLNTNQQALLYSSAKNLEKINFESLILELQMQDSPSK